MTADTILYNGLIRTQSDAQPIVSALAIRGGHILALGDDATIRGLLGAGGEAIDLKGRLVLPGLVDAHVHLTWYAAALQIVDLTHTSSVEEAVERVAARAATLPPGTWVRGHGWAQSEWPGRAFPTAAQLDARIPDHPVYLTAHSAHAAWVNTAALRLAGVTASTADPDGGKISRDAAGAPDGLLIRERHAAG